MTMLQMTFLRIGMMVPIKWVQDFGFHKIEWNQDSQILSHSDQTNIPGRLYLYGTPKKNKKELPVYYSTFIGIYGIFCNMLGIVG